MHYEQRGLSHQKRRFGHSHSAYDSWRQVAGYFDGDGAVYVSIRKYVLKVRLVFSDVWRPQLVAIRGFLESKGIPVNRPRFQRKPNGLLWNLTIGEPSHMIHIMKRILPLCCKKRGDLLIALNYLEDRVTAKEAIEQLNQMVRTKRRSGFIRSFDVPLRRSEGARCGRRRGAQAGAKATTIRVSLGVQERIRKDRQSGLTLMELRSKYGHGLRVIQRILHRDRIDEPNQI